MVSIYFLKTLSRGKIEILGEKNYSGGGISKFRGANRIPQILDPVSGLWSLPALLKERASLSTLDLAFSVQPIRALSTVRPLSSSFIFSPSSLLSISCSNLASSHPAYSSQQKEENARFSHLKRNSGTNHFKDPEGRRRRKKFHKDLFFSTESSAAASAPPESFTGSELSREMALMRGEPLVTKLAVLAKYVVLPGAMVAALIYSPPDYTSSKNDPKSTK
ncbi:hypothetical protein GBA52_000441 [Prunus armeniaca]|nr:hypothetical protein GBA52_000441 [Prunus armeniaca]